MNIDLLAFGAHPDDTELGCSGTIASLVKRGNKVVVVDLTRGEMGSRGSAELRKKEAADAVKILGLHDRINLGFPDTELENTREFQLPIIQAVRRYRPKICFLPPLVDRHPDHGKASRLILDALFYSGLIKIETTEPDTKVQKPYRPQHILHYLLATPFKPDFVFDISDTIETNEKAILAFSSQFNVKDDGEEAKTFVSDPAFFEMLRARAKMYGHQAGFEYGEPFKVSGGPVGIQEFDFLK